MQKQTKIIIAVVAALILLAGAFATVWFLTRPEPETGAKALHIDIVADGVTTPLDFRTDALYLRQALEEQITIEGEESLVGTSMMLMVKSVNGRTADESKQEFWLFRKNGMDMTEGVDTAVISDGDTFEIVLTIWS